MSDEEIICTWHKKIEALNYKMFSLQQKVVNKIKTDNLTMEEKVAQLWPNIPICFPPYGIELPVSVYELFKERGIPIPQYVWCASGKEMHLYVRMENNLKNYHKVEIQPYTGTYIAQKGFYKIVGETIQNNEVFLSAYYNYKDSNAFVKEEVLVKRSPFYNNSSIGPKYHTISENDIIEVIEHTKLVERTYQNKTYKAYQIHWRLITISSNDLPF